MLVEIETDKVAIEVSAPTDGVLSEILANDGDTVTPNQVIARIGGAASGGGAPRRPAALRRRRTDARQPASRRAEDARARAEPATAGAPQTLSPSVQRIVSETGLDPSTVQGTGKDGRLTKGDALAATQGGQPQAKAPAAAARAAASRRCRPPRPPAATSRTRSGCA